MSALVSNIRDYCILLVYVSLVTVATAVSGDLPLRYSGSPKYLSFAGTDSVFQVGEELTYNVSYAFYDIGQVKIKIIDKITDGKKTYYKASANIDSYKGVPFVDLHSIYESNIDSSFFSHQFRSRIKKDDGWYGFTYHFNYKENKVMMDQGWSNSNKIDKRDSLVIDTLSQDGLSLFFLARQNVLSARTMNIPTVVSETKGNTLIHFTNEHTDEKIDAVDYPVDCVHFEGNAGFVGIFGLTGDFEGWFSNDEARVPILAKMKVILGSIRIELMRWKRANWAPPKYNESGR